MDARERFLDISSGWTIEYSMCSVPPHPYPLPKERGNSRLSSSDLCGFDSGLGSVAPSPWGEGRSEGELD